MSSEPGPKTTTLGVSIADNITLRSATIVALQPADTRRAGGAVVAGGHFSGQRDGLRHTSP